MEWLKKHPSAFGNSGVYLNALPSLNYDRFVRHVVLEPLRQMRDKCRKDAAPEYSYLETMFLGIGLHYVEVGPDEFEEVVCYEVASSPLCTLKEWLLNQSRMSCSVPDARKTNSELMESSRDSLYDYLDGLPERETTLTRAREDGMMHSVLGYWGDDEAKRFFDAVDYLESHYTLSGSESILDDIDAL